MTFEELLKTTWGLKFKAFILYCAEDGSLDKTIKELRERGIGVVARRGKITFLG